MCVLPLTASVLFLKKSIFRFPNIACELLTCDVGVINDKLGNEEPLLETLYAFLEQPSPLNPLLASFFSKTIGNLITRKTEQVMRWARRRATEPVGFPHTSARIHKVRGGYLQQGP